ncbi:recombination-associated protein RdgC [Hydrogenophaga sp.]|uniref:recombination-associated protein RdgC n=1 Tax=Hydrogenophaga sp. TaxID=1904254 RepID=UPI00261D70C1|nr:recombination-associated protein RdgC [Hydrogenophaga sp.]MDM7949542.1 recombination-associated protein RdgC [Hydrogenophaga sp.]
MFKNVTLYRIAPGWAPTLQAMETALDGARFAPCGATQDKAVGWVEPRGEAHGPLVESVAGQRVLKLMIETKTVPGAVVREHAQEQADHIEASTGRKPGKKETKALREDALLALLPQAFPRRSSAWVWIDPANGWLVTDASSQGKLDELVTALVRAFDGLAIQLLQTSVTPQTAMTQWLAATSPDAWPEGFHVERECELKSADEEKSVVRFTRHNLATDEVRQHIAEGKLPTRLALSWEGRIGLVLTESLQLKKINFLEGVFDDRSDDGESGFDTNVTLATGELQKLIPALIAALGGELELGAPAATDVEIVTPARARREAVTASGDDGDPPF